VWWQNVCLAPGTPPHLLTRAPARLLRILPTTTLPPQAPKVRHPGSIMALSNTGGHGRGAQSGRIIGE
jgi:hypothetical protein